MLANLFVSFLYILNFDRAYSITEDGLLMTFNFTNANQAGMFLMNTVLYLSIIMLTNGLFRSKLLRLICLPIIVAIVAFVYFTGCRSSLGALSFFLALVVIDFLSRGNFNLKRWHVIVWALSPLLFAFLYMAFIQSLDIDTSFGIEDHGKDNTTRLGVWSKGLSGITDYIIFGEYYDLEKKIGFSHMHNIHLDVLVCYGLIPFIFYVVALFRSAWKTHLYSNGKIQRLSLYAFFTCIVSGFFEATLVSGSGGLFLFSFGFLLLANMKDEDIQYRAIRKRVKIRLA